MTSSFPANFTWGAAAAAYQIEGAWDTDGKRPSVWDMMTEQRGKVFDGHTGRMACDHYNRYRSDVSLMKAMGLQAYRLSVCWPRVMPAGVGAVNTKGLDFYDKLVDELLAAGIQPWVTLFHWDYPYDLFLRGGWLNADSPHWFADYTEVMVDRLSDRVSNWITLNEPQCFIGMGHLTGEHAPGLKLGMAEVLLAGHHALKAHGLAVQVIRARAQSAPLVGWAPVGCISHPYSDSPEDAEAAMRVMSEVYPDNLWNNRWWGDPPVHGHYPEEGLRAYGSLAPKVKPGDMETICQPLDFYGCNIYQSSPIRAGKDGSREVMPHSVGQPHTHFVWRVSPEALYWGPKFLAEQYKLPVVITENGLSSCDWVGLDGRVSDGGRIDFLRRYLRELDRAIADGVDVRGYFHWSIMDNFEWAEGYKHRFGLVHVDYETQKRTLKDSAFWYRDVINTNGASLYSAGEQSTDAISEEWQSSTLSSALESAPSV